MRKRASPLNLKISFIKKNYGKLQPFRQQEAPYLLKTNNSKKLPLITSNQINLKKNEDKIQIINKINRKKTENFAIETLRKVRFF